MKSSGRAAQLLAFSGAKKSLVAWAQRQPRAERARRRQEAKRKPAPGGALITFGCAQAGAKARAEHAGFAACRENAKAQASAGRRC